MSSPPPDIVLVSSAGVNTNIYNINRAPIDFDLGTTASTGIEVGEVLTSLDDELAEAAYEEYEDEVRGAVEDNKNILVLMKNIWSVRARGRDQLRALL